MRISLHIYLFHWLYIIHTILFIVYIVVKSTALVFTWLHFIFCCLKTPVSSLWLYVFHHLYLHMLFMLLLLYCIAEVVWKKLCEPYKPQTENKRERKYSDNTSSFCFWPLEGSRTLSADEHQCALLLSMYTQCFAKFLKLLIIWI